MTKNDLTSVIQELGANLGIADLEMGSDGQAALTVGPLEMALIPATGDPEVLWIMAKLGDLGDDPEVPAFLLQANFFAWHGFTMTVALEETNDDGFEVIAFTAVPMTMVAAASLTQTFKTFAEAALALHGRLVSQDYSPLDPTTLQDAPPPHMGAMLHV